MATNIAVINLSYQVNDDDLRAAFEQHGKVDKARVVIDRDTGRSRGLGFVEMPDRSEAVNAIEQLNGAEFCGRPLRVNEAKPVQRGALRRDRPRR